MAKSKRTDRIERDDVVGVFTEHVPCGTCGSTMTIVTDTTTDDRGRERPVKDGNGVVVKWLSDSYDTRRYYDRRTAIECSECRHSRCVRTTMAVALPFYQHHPLATRPWFLDTRLRQVDTLHADEQWFVRVDDAVFGETQLRIAMGAAELRRKRAEREAWWAKLSAEGKAAMLAEAARLEAGRDDYDTPKRRAPRLPSFVRGLLDMAKR